MDDGDGTRGGEGVVERDGGGEDVDAAAVRGGVALSAGAVGADDGVVGGVVGDQRGGGGW